MFGISQSLRVGGWQLALASCLGIGGAITTIGNCALAQIVPDGTLPNNSSVTTSGNISIISGGTQAGSNLFHSFEVFSLPTGSMADFNNALDIQNIISRVTGSSISNIDGLIKAKGTANLFMINPNGIIFGPNAKLNIGGSFLASTASSLKFADGTYFSAEAPQTTPLLTISVPIGLQFGGNAGSIQVQGFGQGIRSGSELIDSTVGLRVQPNRTLAMVGGDLALEGGTLKTAGGRIELGSVAGSGLVSLVPIDKGFALGYSGVSNFGNIQLSGRAAVDASGAGGGDIQVQGRRVTLQDGSQIEASTLESESGGTLLVSASDSVELRGISANGLFSGLFTATYESATGKAGDLTIATRKLIVRDGAQLSTTTFGRGRAGNLSVTASDFIEVRGFGNSASGTSPSLLYTSVLLRGATGAGGNLTLKTGRLILRDGAQILTDTRGTGPAGNLFVNASESVELRGSTADKFISILFVGTLGTGKAGDLTINTPVLLVQDGTVISAGTMGLGKGGSLNVNASKSVQVIGTSADGQFPSRLSARTLGTEKAGDLKITTPVLLISDGAQVTVSSTKEGAAGDLSITASSVRLDNGKIVAQTRSGNGGNLTLGVADLLLLRRGSEISTTAGTAQAGGDGGNITINAGDGFIVAVPSENSDITANAYTGRGGSVRIKAQDIFGIQRRKKQTAESDITASSQFGLSGTVDIKTPDVDPSQGLVKLPAVPVNVEVAQGCQTGGKQSSVAFYNTGRGGIAPNPYEPLSSSHIWEDVPSPSTSASPATVPDKIVEAKGWIVNEKGEVTLVAEVPATASQGRCRLH